jgi:hypothetical protein
MKLSIIALALAASTFAFSAAQAQSVVVKEGVTNPGVTVRTTTGTAVRHCVNRKVTTVNSAGVKITKTVRRCD